MVSAANDPRKAGSIWALNLDANLPEVPPQLTATFCQVGLESAPALAEAMGPSSLPEIHRRFEAGRQAYAAWVGRDLAAYGWVSFDEEIVGELNLRLRLIPGEAYIWDCATLAPYRQLHLYSALLAHMTRELYLQPVCRAWIGANLDNLASQRGIARAGFHRVANLLVERVLGVRMVWAQGNPDVPESWVAEARRVYLGSREKVWLDAVSRGR